MSMKRNDKILLQIIFIIFIRSYSINSTMRSKVIIKYSVFFYFLFCFRNRIKDIPVQAFLSEFSNKTFNITIFPWRTFWNKFMFNSMILKKNIKTISSEFRSPVRSDNFRFTIFEETIFKHFGNRICSNIEININTDTKSGKYILNNKTFKVFSIINIIKSKINSPDVICMFRVRENKIVIIYFFEDFLLANILLQSERFVNSINFFMINLKSFLNNNRMNSSISV